MGVFFFLASWLAIKSGGEVFLFRWKAEKLSHVISDPEMDPICISSD